MNDDIFYDEADEENALIARREPCAFFWGQPSKDRVCQRPDPATGELCGLSYAAHLGLPESSITTSAPRRAAARGSRR